MNEGSSIPKQLLEILDPVAPDQPRPRRLAQRLGDVRGKRLGLLDNTKPNAGLLLKELGALAKQQLGVSEVVFLRKRTSNVSAGVLLDEMARTCDAVVTSNGD